VEEGFVVVVQDVRGRFESDGEWEPFEHERVDGYETVEWAARQPWSDGHVGIYGASYHGVTALQAAAADPPLLDAAFAYSTGCNYQHGFVYESGAFELGFCLYWTLGLTRDEERSVEDPRVLESLADARANPEKYAERRPTAELLPTAKVARYWRTWLDHPEYDEYWRDLDVGPALADVDTPVLHLSGWYDIFLQSHLEIAERLRDAGHDHHRFVVGPWDHVAYTTGTPSKVGDRLFGPNAATGTGFMSSLALDWFGRWLDDKPEVESKPSVQYFQMGHDEWRDSDEWPRTTILSDSTCMTGAPRRRTSETARCRARNQTPTSRPTATDTIPTIPCPRMAVGCTSRRSADPASATRRRCSPVRTFWRTPRLG
jgi:putative CocE/NonD family hydrolase